VAITTIRIADGGALSLHRTQRARLRQRPTRRRETLQLPRLRALRNDTLATRGEDIRRLIQYGSKRESTPPKANADSDRCAALPLQKWAQRSGS
jgi:hypothetical protein